jgi:hypothetical protein
LSDGTANGSNLEANEDESEDDIEESISTKISVDQTTATEFNQLDTIETMTQIVTETSRMAQTIPKNDSLLPDEPKSIEIVKGSPKAAKFKKENLFPEDESDLHSSAASSKAASIFGQSTAGSNNNLFSTRDKQPFVLSEEGNGGENEAMSADDFLPLFAYILVQTNLPEILMVKEIMDSLVDSDEKYGECGYYIATLEASIQLILNLSASALSQIRLSSEKRTKSTRQFFSSK